ncbi:zinc finger CCCH domain-containing protein 62 isoform X2 [Malania oleifera]|uniref:zinc finger CCCH domain-containing protein 62 isoform X2 n=1 Tax=Malania oleifera TaxID=397392 RepID=UPI0025ADAA5B|nr:zinc finger CCCH domain-containing protein 62 isoform X2 [Malania oleifera]
MSGSQRRAKRSFICISSSSDEDEEDHDDDDNDDDEEEEGEDVEDEDEDEVEEEEDDEENDDDDDDEEEEEEERGSDQTSSDDKSDEEEESDGQEESDEDDEDLDDESLSNTVIRLLREKSDLQTLNLQACKAYLQKFGLRLTGTKAVCLQRIKEHWRIKDGNGEAHYPRSSFVINCTGDVCKGDIVLFKQKVYEKFDKVKRKGRLIGNRTVAGRVVKESYGAAKQQHTFTVEVLWSRGIKKLPPLFPLLVKGRNLYKLKTFRQHWKNEAERSKVLTEKHKRGRAARLVRARKKMKKTWSASEGKKGQKHCRGSRPSQGRPEQHKMKHADGRGKGKTLSLGHANSISPCQKAPPVEQENLKHGAKYRSVKTSGRHHKHTFHYKDRVTHFQPDICRLPDIYQSHMDFHHGSAPVCFSRQELGSSYATTQPPHFRPYAGLSMMPEPRHQGLHYGSHTPSAYSVPRYELEPRNLIHFPGMNTYRPLCPPQRNKYF